MIFIQVTESPQLDFFSLIWKGGFVMIPLGFILVISIYLIIERWLYFNAQDRITSDKNNRHIAILRSGETHPAVQLCAEEKGAWGRIFIHAGNMDSAKETDELLSDAINIEISQFEKGLSGLSLIAGVAPLLGFIGTIIGVINIFFDISVSQDISIGVISEGLYQKMISSATGLFVGILAFAANQLFQQRIDRFIRRIQQHALLVKLAIKEGNLK
jgi:biopolymer transport protein ExbB